MKIGVERGGSHEITPTVPLIQNPISSLYISARECSPAQARGDPREDLVGRVQQETSRVHGSSSRYSYQRERHSWHLVSSFIILFIFSLSISFILSFIFLFIVSFILSFILTFIHPLINSFSHLFIHPLGYSFIYSYYYPIIHFFY